MRSLTLFLYLLCALFVNCSGSSSSSTGTGSLSGKYLMTFHACDTATSTCTDASKHYTYLAQSTDGVAWTTVPGFTPYSGSQPIAADSGSVPSPIRRGDTVYIYNPNTLHRYSISNSAVGSAVSVNLTGGSTAESFVDPCPILSNGKIVLFYLVSSGSIGSNPASCPTGQTTCTKVFHSATEVSGSDGATLSIDSGDRADIAINTMGSVQSASDPAVFLNSDGSFSLFISIGPSVEAMSSATLQGSYANNSSLSNGTLVASPIGGVPSGIYDSASGKYWVYVTSGSGSTNVIKRAVVSDLNSPIPASSFTTVISGATYPGFTSTYTTESPGIVANTP